MLDWFINNDKDNNIKKIIDGAKIYFKSDSDFIDLLVYVGKLKQILNYFIKNNFELLEKRIIMIYFHYQIICITN